jgi:hypothetical protein
VGIGWESGIVSGLMEGGVDLSQADLIVGTSAGSFVGANLAMGRNIAHLAETYIAEQQEAVPATQPAAHPPDLSILIGKMQEAVSGVRPAKEVRAEIGAWALTAKTISEQDSSRASAAGSLAFPKMPGLSGPLPARRLTPRTARSWFGTGNQESGWRAPWPQVAACRAYFRPSRSVDAAILTAACVRRPMRMSRKAMTQCWWLQ